MSSTRDHIIAVTCDLIELQGYHATGLNQIIKESGTPKGSLYHYFPGGKEALAVEAIQQAGETILQRITEKLAETENPAQAVRDFILNIAFHVENSGFRAGGPITAIAMETAASSDALRETCQDIYSGWQGAFREKLTSSGLSATRAESLAMMIIASIEGGVILCRTSRSRAPLEHIAEELSRCIAGAV